MLTLSASLMLAACRWPTFYLPYPQGIVTTNASNMAWAPPTPTLQKNQWKKLAHSMYNAHCSGSWAQEEMVFCLVSLPHYSCEGTINSFGPTFSPRLCLFLDAVSDPGLRLITASHDQMASFSIEVLRWPIVTGGVGPGCGGDKCLILPVGPHRDMSCRNGKYSNFFLSSPALLWILLRHMHYLKSLWKPSSPASVTFGSECNIHYSSSAFTSAHNLSHSAQLWHFPFFTINSSVVAMLSVLMSGASQILSIWTSTSAVVCWMCRDHAKVPTFSSGCLQLIRACFTGICEVLLRSTLYLK